MTTLFNNQKHIVEADNLMEKMLLKMLMNCNDDNYNYNSIIIFIITLYSI